jgi:hypothetical protein
MKTISISISDEDYKFIKFVAKDNGRTMAAEIRHALTVYYAPDQTPQIVKPAGRHPHITEDRVLSRPDLCT